MEENQRGMINMPMLEKTWNTKKQPKEGKKNEKKKKKKQNMQDKKKTNDKMADLNLTS